MLRFSRRRCAVPRRPMSTSTPSSAMRFGDRNRFFQALMGDFDDDVFLLEDVFHAGVDGGTRH